MKPPKETEQLLSLLKKGIKKPDEAEKKIAPHVPLITRKLYELSPDQPILSVLDELMGKKGFRQKSTAGVKDDVKNILPELPRSNILRFDCRNAYIGPKDLFNIQPIPRERLYLYKPPLTNGISFSSVKARHPLTLLFSGAYYLFFPNHFQACLYYMETRDRVVNGYPFKLKFVTPTTSHLRLIGSPYLEPDGDYKLLRQSRLDPHKDFDKIFSVSADKSSLLPQINSADFSEDTLTVEPHPVYEQLQNFANIKSRLKLVLVRNLPFGLKRDDLTHLLWNYNFHNLHNPSASFTDIINEPTTQTHLTVIHFGDELSAQRFVRNYHGRRWDPTRKNKEQALYQPLLCEILE